ncbi:TraB/GumN family protein [Tritonibacter horizontis]|uniref:TraB family protein n=1 Tax=Tritonibacter horizontis TaxID=1768241 RepID=A0A132C0I2_9RHOB|nr:TraB/GumN family protein [Tritonibacter horizontis]KUP94079.1 TraB family protein [Tritonibacter horizontis]
MTGLFSRLRRAQRQTGTIWLRRVALAVGVAGAAASAQAACTGTDLRQDLPAALKAEIAAEVARTPYAKGLSWIATRGDRRLHVIGTMHLNDPRHAPLVRHMTPAIEAADAMLVEVTAADKAALEAKLGKRPELIFITDGPTLIDRLPPEDWAEIADLARAAGIPPFMAAKMRPWFLSMSLSIPNCARRIPNVSHGLDMQLLEVAAEHGVPTLSLEDPMEIFRTLDAAPLAEQVEELRSYLAMMRVGPDEFFTMLESYFDGEVEAFTRVQMKQFLAADLSIPTAERAAQIEALMGSLLYDRNRAWVPVIESAPGNLLVVAVGAAHLPGETGVLALLEAAGYTIEEAPL